MSDPFTITVTTLELGIIGVCIFVAGAIVAHAMGSYDRRKARELPKRQGDIFEEEM